jgi:spore coat protein U-like protein
MKKGDKAWVLVAFIVLAISVGLLYAGGGNTETTNTVTVLATCSLTSGTNPIAFGNINPGDTSAQDTHYTTITNTGNAATQVLVNGSAWTSGGNSFPANYTHWYNATGQSYYNKKWLNITQQVANNSLGAGQSFTVFMDLMIPSGQAAGSYTQTVWFTSSC